MLCIYNDSTEPYYNMAAEEYLLKNFKEDIFMLWRNDNAIICGKHQNSLAEINIDYVKQNSIKVVRRLSGGGAVFHDLGNLNFTFIVTGDPREYDDFSRFTQPIIDVLRNLDVDARFEGRNDLTIDGMKFSGNAKHIYRDRILQHGTLLFTSDMKDLTSALNVNPLKFSDKKVKSVRSRVTNISEHLKQPLTLDEFSAKIMAHVLELYPYSMNYGLTPADRTAIQALADEKYSKWEWNFGYHGEYNFNKAVKSSGGFIEFHLNVEKGIIAGCRIYGDYFSMKDTTDVEKALTGLKHEENTIREALAKINLNEYFMNSNIDEIMDGLF